MRRGVHFIKAALIKLKPRNTLEKTLLITLIINLAISLFFHDIFNVYCHELTANLLLSNRNPASIIVNDPVLINERPTSGAPLALYILLIPYFLSKVFKLLSFVLAIKFMLTICNLIATLFFFKTLMLLNNEDKKAMKYSLLSALNPFILLSIHVHMLLDIVAIMFVITSMYYLILYSIHEKRKHALISSFMLGAGIAVRIYPAVLLPIFLSKLRKKAYYLVPSFLLPSMLSLPFLVTDPKAYFSLLFRPFGGTSPLIVANPSNAFFIMMIALLFYAYYCAYTNRNDIILNSLLSILAINIGMGPYFFSYFSWSYPLLILALYNKNRYAIFLPLFLSIPYIFWTFTIGGLEQPAGATGYSYYMIHLIENPKILRQEYPFLHDIFNIIVLCCGVLIIFWLFLIISGRKRKI